MIPPIIFTTKSIKEDILSTIISFDARPGSRKRKYPNSKDCTRARESTGIFFFLRPTKTKKSRSRISAPMNRLWIKWENSSCIIFLWKNIPIDKRDKKSTAEYVTIFLTLTLLKGNCYCEQQRGKYQCQDITLHKNAPSLFIKIL